MQILYLLLHGSRLSGFSLFPAGILAANANLCIFSPVWALCPVCVARNQEEPSEGMKDRSAGTTFSQDWLISFLQQQPAKQVNKGISTPTGYIDFKLIVCVLSDFENYKLRR